MIDHHAQPPRIGIYESDTTYTPLTWRERWKRRKQKPAFIERRYFCYCGENVTDQLRRKFDTCPTRHPLIGICSRGHKCRYECAT